MSGLVEREDSYLLIKRGLYWAPDGKGYTGRKDRAGRYPASHASPENGTTAIHEDDAPEFSPACWEETKLAAKDERIAALEAEVERKDAALREISAKVIACPHSNLVGRSIAATLAGTLRNVGFAARAALEPKP